MGVTVNIWIARTRCFYWIIWRPVPHYRVSSFKSICEVWSEI